MFLEKDQIEKIAKVCHEVNRAYCRALEDYSQQPWEKAPTWQKESAVFGVMFHLDNPDAGPESSHEQWLGLKEYEGWTYGPKKDEQKKTHPYMIPFEDLPVTQQAKDYIFHAIVHAMK